MANQQHEKWPAFTVPWDDTSSGPTDMSFLLDKPAGATGFVQIVDGHLATGDGRRWRIWGQNLTFGAALVPMELAPTVARRMAKYGINCIRLHHMDHRYPRGLLLRHSGKTPVPESQPGVARRDVESTRALDPEAMARLDYLVACCRDNGIYTDINLNVSRPFTVADGVKQVEWVGYGKGLTYFDPRLIALQKEYAAQLLGHVNPFTGNAYAEEPAVAIVELVNENSLLESWMRGRLRGEQTEPAGTWSDIPPAYAADLDRLWNGWLARRYPDREALAAAWGGDLREFEDPRAGSVRRLRPEEFAAAEAGRFHDEATFYAELERDFFREMESYLRGDLGVRQVIVGTSDHHHSIHQQLHVENNARVLGIVDGHTYWQHPRFPGAAWSRTEWTITNTPMVDQPDHSSVAQLSRSVVKGMPYIVSELNAPFPNDYAAEFIPILAAYSLLQDWDGLFWFAYGGSASKEGWQDQAIRSYFSMANDPVKMTETAMGALVFLRGDVQQAAQLVERHLTRERVLESLRFDLPTDTYPYAIPYLPGRLALVHRTAIADFDAEELAPAEGALHLPPHAIASDTGELLWEDKPAGGWVTAHTPRYEAIVGRAGSYAAGVLAFDLETPFAAVQLASLEDAPLAEASRMLLVATARVANSGMAWLDEEARHSMGANWGEAPTRIEPVTGTLRLRALPPDAAPRLHPLDGRGQPTGAARPFIRDGDTFTINLRADPPTLWYLIEV